MHLALYRAERPERFNEIIGQKHIVRILQNQLAKGSVSQAYLFAGTRGTGKTTTARILAKAVNCTGTDDSAAVPCGTCPNCTAIKEGRFLDVIELDAASNNGVEDLRAIIDSVQYPPSVGKYKVYIIDEVHMLSQAAENAFLKTLEEPPDYAIFILATTDPDKVRQTIRSRCMTLNFRRVSEADLIAGMRAVCDKRAVKIEEDALAVIAARADGSVRDALSLLEQCISGGDELVTRDLVYEYTGSAGLAFYMDLTDRVISGEVGQALALIDRTIKEGKDAKQLITDWLGHYRDLMISKYVDSAEDIIGSSAENVARLKAQADTIDNRELDRALKILSEENNRARYSGMPRLLLEAAAIRLSGTDTEEISNITRKASNPASAQRSVPDEPEKPHPVPAPNANASTPDNTNKFDLDDIWHKISNEMARTDRSFVPMVANHSRITSFHNGEVVLTIKRNKMMMAEAAKDKLDLIAKKYFSDDAFFIIKAGDVDQISLSDLGLSSSAAAPAQQTSAPSDANPSDGAGDFLDESDAAETAAESLSDFLGIDVNIT